MNVEKELADVRRRVRVQIDRSAREALIRAGIDVDAEKEAARVARVAEVRDAADTASEQFGRNLRVIRDEWVRMLDGIARGFNGGTR